MNGFWLAAGLLITVSGFIHMILGDRWIFNQLDEAGLETHYSPEITKITLRWFWHVGSFMIFFNAVLVLLMALTEGTIPAENFIATLVIIIYAGFISVLLLVNVENLRNLMQFPQLPLFMVFIVLLYLGFN